MGLVLPGSVADTLHDAGHQFNDVLDATGARHDNNQEKLDNEDRQWRSPRLHPRESPNVENDQRGQYHTEALLEPTVFSLRQLGFHFLVGKAYRLAIRIVVKQAARLSAWSAQVCRDILAGCRHSV